MTQVASAYYIMDEFFAELGITPIDLAWGLNYTLTMENTNIIEERVIDSTVIMPHDTLHVSHNGKIIASHSVKTKIVITRVQIINGEKEGKAFIGALLIE